MKEFTLSQKYAIVALNGLESLHRSLAKDAVLHALKAAEVMEDAVEDGVSHEVFSSKLQEAVEQAKSLKRKEAKRLEEEMAAYLSSEGVLEQIPDILGCDMDYETAGVELKAYRSEEATHLSIREGVRAEILDDGEVSDECGVLLWLFRESGCMCDIFSAEEQNRVQERMLALAAGKENFRLLWKAEFYRMTEKLSEKFLRAKKNLFKNPYLEGVNLVFPYLERRNAIFIDFVVLGTNVQQRRIAVMEHLSEKGHYVEEVKMGEETLLKIDNNYYRIFPSTRRAYKVPIQGANIVPVYW